MQPGVEACLALCALVRRQQARYLRSWPSWFALPLGARDCSLLSGLASELFDKAVVRTARPTRIRPNLYTAEVLIGDGCQKVLKATTTYGNFSDMVLEFANDATVDVVLQLAALHEQLQWYWSDQDPMTDDIDVKEQVNQRK